MDKVLKLTQEDRARLARIDRAVQGARSPGGVHPQLGGDGRKDLCALLVATTPQADPAFARQLETRLLARHAGREQLGSQAYGWLSVRWRRGLAVAAALLLVVTVALAAIGPRRVWAQVQQWLGYVPGIGFVDLEATRVLTAPVAATRDGVTLTVAQVVAQAEGTTVVLESQGLPREDQVIPEGPSMAPDFEPRLRLPDGRELAPETFTLRWGAGTVVFPALPPEVYRVTLVLPTLPLAPLGVAPEDWALPLALRPATGELVAALFPQPYAPPDASDTRHGVTLRVLESAHSPEETAMRVQLQWSDPAWERHGIRGAMLSRLTDDLGHAYSEQVGGSRDGSLSQSVVVAVQPDTDGDPEPDPAIPTAMDTLTFAPVSPAAQALTLTLGGFDFDVPAAAALSLDVGDDPQVGDVWPLDMPLEVAGVSVHVQRARLVNEELGRPGSLMLRPTLWFDMAPVAQDEVYALCGLRFDGAVAGFRAGSVGGYDPQSQQIRAGLVIEEGMAIPGGVIHVPIDGARLCLNDAWTVSWEIPSPAGSTDTGLMPAVIRPTEAAQTRQGLTLQVEQVVLTDRLTHVQVGLLDPPEGTTLSAALRWTWPTVSLRGSLGALSLTDDRTHTCGPARAVRWVGARRPGMDLAVASLTAMDFEPCDPLARRLTLTVPAIEIVRPAAVTFDVIVPDGVTTRYDGDTPWPVSPAWEVALPLTLGEQALRFTTAHLADLNGTTMVMLTSTPYAAASSGQWLSGLRLAAVTGPDGRQVDLDNAVSRAGPVAEDDARHELGLGFDVVDPTSGSVQPGSYRVTVDGVKALVKGPWRLAWRVLGGRQSE